MHDYLPSSLRLDKSMYKVKDSMIRQHVLNIINNLFQMELKIYYLFHSANVYCDDGSETVLKSYCREQLVQYFICIFILLIKLKYLYSCIE